MAKGRIILFYLLRKIWPSGMTAFTAHLRQALIDNGYGVVVVRPVSRDKREHPVRVLPFGNYGFDLYEWRSDIAIDCASDDASIICTPQRREFLPDPGVIQKLMRKGSRLVIHDPTNFKDVPFARHRDVGRRVVVREAVLKWTRNAVFLPHPYVRQMTSWEGCTLDGRKHAVCTARIATSKRPRLILKANRLLPKKLRVEMKGAENRMVSYGLQKTYGDVYKQSGKVSQYPQNFEAPVRLCSNYLFHVDMTKFDGDGGGTQYAQLEAIDAGCVPIMHTDWWEGRDRTWSWAVSNAECLARTLKYSHIDHNGYYSDAMAITREHGQKLLKEHDHKRVGRLWAAELGL
jgi:hypothetical protein